MPARERAWDGFGPCSRKRARRGRPVSRWRAARGRGVYRLSVAGDRIDRLERAALHLVDRDRCVLQVALRSYAMLGADTPLIDTLPRYGVYTFGSVEFASFIAVSSAIVPSYEYGEYVITSSLKRAL